MTALLLMTRAPDGEPKTRLSPRLDLPARAALVTAMLEDLLETAGRVPALTPILACTPDPHHPALEALIRRHACLSMSQGEGSLGDRLSRCVAATLARGFERVLVVGSDSPTLPAGILEQALAALDRADVVIGPAFDGGYYLIGLKRLEASLFSDIPWSGPRVLRVTMERAVSSGLEVALLPFWYDIDEPEDLERLLDHVRALELEAGGRPAEVPGARTAGLLRRLLETGEASGG